MQLMKKRLLPPARCLELCLGQKRHRYRRCESFRITNSGVWSAVVYSGSEGPLSQVNDAQSVTPESASTVTARPTGL